MTSVLVLDDDAPIAELMRVILEEAGMSVTVRTSVDELPAGGGAKRDEATRHFVGELPEDGNGSLATLKVFGSGWYAATGEKEQDRSGIVCFKAKGDPMDILARAEAENIIIAVRLNRVRVSPHFYNTEDEIDSLLALL